MKTHLWRLLGTILLTMSMLAGCKSLSRRDSVKTRLETSKAQIQKHIPDHVRAEKLIALYEQLDADLVALATKRDELEKAVLRKSDDFSTSREELEQYYGAYNKSAVAIMAQLVRVHIDMRRQVTPEEWDLIVKQN
jgi:hypothetical protein